jgi:glycosyltransferase involved in cell wall biosynthesis
VSPTVSVIIPTYNRWPLLGDAIDSVLSQTFVDFELIIVDDGSTDETLVELVKYDSRLQVISQINRGVSAARNRGVFAARAPYIAFLDSDDLWLPHKLQEQTSFVLAHTEVGICQTNEIWVRNGRRVNPKVKHTKPSGDIFRRSLELCLVSPSAVMMKKTLFKELGGFDESLPVCEDYDLWLRIAADYEVPLLDSALVIKRGGHADQLSRSVWGMDRYRVLVLQKLLKSGLVGGKRDATVEVLKRKLQILANGARKRGKRQAVLGYEAALAELSG